MCKIKWRLSRRSVFSWWRTRWGRARASVFGKDRAYDWRICFGKTFCVFSREPYETSGAAKRACARVLRRYFREDRA